MAADTTQVADAMFEIRIELSGSVSHRELINPAPKEGPSYKGGKR